MEDSVNIKQYLVTPAAGKRLIAKSLLAIPSIKEALEKRTIVIVAGTTNAYVAEEILNEVNQSEDFSRDRFFRGVTLPPKYKFSTDEKGMLKSEDKFPGDVVIVKGKWMKGQTIYDVADDLQRGDIIFKGANALDLDRKQVGIYIGHPKAGTIIAAMQAAFGRRVQLYLPVGLEKRVNESIDSIAKKLNSINASGYRMLPVSGEVVTELDAIKILTGAEAELVASGGVCGAEGSCWLVVSGNDEQITNVESLMKLVSQEPNFQL